jgi:molybdopterin-guanine dinucleotide biosynthesis protein A
MKMDAVVLAGGMMSPEDPLYPQGRGGFRSLIDILGIPMAQRVINALSASSAVSELYVVGLSSDSDLTSEKPLHFLADQGDIFENIRYGVLRASEDHPDQFKVIIASADIPAIRPEMVDWLASEVMKDSASLIYYNVIPQAVMEARFPGSKRSFVHFKDHSVCGGDLNAVDTRLFTIEKPIFKQLIGERKHPLKQAGMLGFGNLFLVALRIGTLERVVKRICKRLDLDARALLCPYAEMAMDADKTHQLDILRQELESIL